MRRLLLIACVIGLALLPGRAAGAPAGSGHVAPWQQYNLSPSSRTLSPVAVFRTHGTVENATAVLSGRSTRITGAGAYLTLDFGKDVGGIITLHFAAASDSNQSVGLAFTESSNYVGTTSDSSNGGTGADGSLTAAVSAPGTYTVPIAKQRGGFRYLTLFLLSAGSVDIDGVSLEFTAAPGTPHPDAYPNYFYSNDELLNRIWYAGAYTVQLDTIAPPQGRVWVFPTSGWNNSGVVGVGTSVLVDGAKRDRTVWPGDLLISAPTDFASIGDMVSLRNAMTTLYQHQDLTGAMPYAGPAVNFPGALSDAYSMASLITSAEYYRYTGDRAWLDGIWSQYRRALVYTLAKTDPSGLMFVTGPADWQPSNYGETVEAQALFYDVLTTCAQLAAAEGDQVTAALCSTKAPLLKAAANLLLWDASKGAYRDNGYRGSTATATPTYSQDGNALAVWYGLVDSPAKAAGVLAYLRGNWNKLGAAAPEWHMGDHPFPGSMEVRAHFSGGDDTNGLALIRREWGYMLNAPQGTRSTFWEGFLADGTFAYNGGPSNEPIGDYTSLAHGWSTGPTAALTFDVLGVAPDSAGGRTYHVVPHAGDLTHAEGRLTMGDGPVDVAWDRGARSFALHVDSRGNAGSTGVIALPRFGGDRVVTVDGRVAWDGSRFAGAPGIASADQDGTYIYFRGVQPGSRRFAWAPAAGGVASTPVPPKPVTTATGTPNTSGGASQVVGGLLLSTVALFTLLARSRRRLRRWPR